MNPAKPATTPAEKLTRAKLTLMSLGLPYAVGYARRHLSKVDQLELAHIIREKHGVGAAAQAMRVMLFSIESALLELVGMAALDRFQYRAAWEAV